MADIAVLGQSDADGSWDEVTKVNPLWVRPNTLAGHAPGMDTFYAASLAYASYATPTDMVGLRNPAASGKLLIPRIVGLLAQSTAAALMKLYWYRRSSLNTGGTPTDLTAVPYDSAQAAGVGVARTYGAAPTIVDAAAPIINQLQLSTTVLTAAPASINSSGGFAGWAFSAVDFASPLVIRPGEELVMNLAGAALPAGFTALFQAVWMEKSLV